MDKPNLRNVLQTGKNLVTAQHHIKGTKPTKLPSAAQLAPAAGLPSIPAGKKAVLYDFWLETFPPCTISSHDLEPIKISDLTLETKHYGKCITLHPVSVNRIGYATRLMVKDDTEAHLALHINDWTDGASSRFSVAGSLMVKEPYLSRDAALAPGIKVFHLSDIIITPINYLITMFAIVDPEAFSCVTPEWIKARGNDFYGTGQYVQAIEQYTCGMELCRNRKDTKFYKLFLRNRSAANMELGCYTETIEDAEKSLLNDGDNVTADEARSKNTKAFVRMSRACYHLQDYQKAVKYLDNAAALSPQDAAVRKDQIRVRLRIQEKETGEYDLSKMYDDSAAGKLRCDYASFTSKVDVRQTATRGKGLFAKQAFKAGDLILCEKAFEVAEKPKNDDYHHALVLPKTGRVYPEAQIRLATALARKLRNNPNLIEAFFKLFDGTGHPSTAMQRVDDLVVLDEFTVYNIALHNSFPCSKERKFDAIGLPTVSGLTVGLWLKASAINHRCDGNAMRSFCGDMMLLRATKDIDEGEEITMPYQIHSDDHATFVEDMQMNWGFKCDCEICQVEAQVSTDHQKLRQKLYASAMLTLHVQREIAFHGAAGSTRAFRDQMEGYVEEFEETYNASLYRGVPKVGFAGFAFIICQYYFNAKQYKSCVKHGIEALRNMGYKVTIVGNHATFNRQRSLLYSQTIVTMLDVAKSFDALGKSSLAADFTELARISQLAFYGDEINFDADRDPKANFIWVPSEAQGRMGTSMPTVPH